MNYLGCPDFDRAMRNIRELAKEEDVTTMKDRIVEAIAMTATATALEVRDAYNLLGSWDDVIRAANQTLKGYKMSDCVDDILVERELLADKLAHEKMATAGISCAKAGRSMRRTIRIFELVALLTEDN